MKLTDIKPEQVVWSVEQGDFIPKVEEESKKAAQHFLDNRVKLEQLI